MVEVVLSATYILNRVPHKKLDKTPYELWKGFAPNLSFLKVWGCLAKVGLPDPKRKNIGSKTYDCVLIGYVYGGYKFMSIDYTFFEVRGAEFFEDVFPFGKSVLTSLIYTIEPNVSNVHADNSTFDIHIDELRRSKSPRVEQDFVMILLRSTNFLAEIILLPHF